jgi:large repetitive protein
VVVMFGLSVAAAGSLAGVVVDEASGTPLSGVTVYAYDLRLSASSVVTNADGVFSISGLADRPHRLLAYPAYTDNHATRIYPEGIDFCAGTLLYPDAAQVTLSLPTAAVLSGRLIEPDGLPAASATVTARHPDYFARAALTDVDGEFEIVGLDGDDWTCEVDLDGLPTQHLGGVYDSEDALVFTVTEQSTTDVGEHILLPGVTIEGGVYGPDDPAGEGTNVIVYAGGQITTAQTDADGRYVADGLPTGSVISWSEPAGLALTYYPDNDRPTLFLEAPDEGMLLSDVDLFAPTESSLTVTLIDGETGETVEGPGLMLYNSNGTVGKGATAGADGVGELVGLHGGDYTLYIYAADEGFTDDHHRDADGAEAVISIPDATNTALTISIPPAVTLSGTITDDTGQPVYGALVLALSEDEAESTSTDADGRYILDGLPAGDWELQASYGGYCDADPGWTTAYYPGTPNGGAVEAIPTAAGDDLSDINLVIPIDNDHDGMADAWERIWGLDVGLDDGLEDLDGDGYSNLYEYRAGTNPADSLAGCGSAGCGRGSAAALLLLPLFGLRRRR